MNVKRELTCMAAAAVSFLAWDLYAFARTNTIVNGASDWSKPSSFADPSWLPGDGDDDTVIVPAGEVAVSDANAASLAQFRRLKRVILASEGSRIVFDVSGDVEAPVPVTSYGYVTGDRAAKCGPIVKRGAGTLVLSSAALGDSASYDYCSDIVVEGGILKLPQTLSRDAYYGTIAVSNGATAFLPGAPAAVAEFNVYVNSLAGEGMVTNDTLRTYHLRFSGKAGRDDGDFSGRLCGAYSDVWFESDCQSMLNADSGFTCGQLHLGGSRHMRIEALSIGGAAGSDTALGSMSSATAPILWTPGYGGRLVYAGTGETVTRAIQLDGYGNFVMDGGRHGGLVWSQGVQRYYKSARGVGLVLAGAAGTTNTMSATITDYTDSATASVAGHGVYLSKEGAGTWLLSGSRGNFSCGISVNEGVLQYDSIAEKGVASSLGYATNLTDHTLGANDSAAAHRVGYALRLGATTVDGDLKESARLEYVGTANFVVTNREIAVAGNGGLRSNGTARQRFAGVYGSGSGEKTLHLDGSGDNGSEVMDVSDGTDGGILSIVKDGTGTWTLSGSQTWTGDLAVNGGELIVRKPTHYTWYRWTVTALQDTASTDQSATWLYCDEIALCDKDGNLVNLHGTGISKASDVLALDPGTAIVTSDTEFDELANMVSKVEDIFDDVSGGKYAMFKDRSVYPVQGDPSTWITIHIRLPEGAPEVVGYDYFNHYKDRAGMGGYFIDASLDGIHWDRVKTMTPCPVRTSNGYWMYQFPANFQRFGTGMHDKWNDFDATAPESLPSVMESVRSYSVSGGGKLTLAAGGGEIAISRLKVNVLSGGTIDGFSFAPSGAVDISGTDGNSQITLPVAIVNDGNTLSNLANWDVSIGGRAKPMHRLLVAPGGSVSLVPPGFVVVVR